MAWKLRSVSLAAGVAGASVLACALALVAGSSSAVHAAGDSRPSAVATGKIGFVDIEDAINGYKKTKELKEKLQKDYNEKKKKVEDEIKKINEDAEELQLLSPESAEYKKKQRDLQLRALTNNMDKKINEETVDEMLGNVYKEVYNDIHAALAKLSQEEGYSAILIVNRKDFQVTGEKAVTAAIRSRTAAYYDPSLDVTDRLLAKLNP